MKKLIKNVVRITEIYEKENTEEVIMNMVRKELKKIRLRKLTTEQALLKRNLKKGDIVTKSIRIDEINENRKLINKLLGR